ncbi:hypothetical protein BS47DRAFT_1385816 [Hydnum rufescens UP504]|uniref:Uncharacterized protein n=1 Tax=Hydnum rufescens UP504 TaxID=1448309 RepID=A0A9P6AHB3_9AGAM|nr:hypothetical protein BS47DRAFT_1385816 [Hydnum rufescens UP504]
MIISLITPRRPFEFAVLQQSGAWTFAAGKDVVQMVWRALWYTAITKKAGLDTLKRLTPDAAEAAICQLMKKFDIDPEIFEDASGDPAKLLLISDSPWKELTDAETFELYCSRIPTDVFKSIVVDMDIMLIQYGPLSQHKTEEARSRFFSPVFNHLVKLFTFMLRNQPETMVEGRIDTRGRVEYFFKTFGAVAILCIETKLKIGNNDERLATIAQVIAECDGCDLDNAKNSFSLPIYCILCDELSFEFFKFERNPNPTFRRGCFHGDPKRLRRGLRVPDFEEAESALPFILHLRCVCEIIFDVMLRGYIAGLEAYEKQSKAIGDKQGSKRSSLDGWDQAHKSAQDALAMFRNAEDQRRGGDVYSANTTVKEAILMLNRSTGAVPTMYHSELIMSGGMMLRSTREFCLSFEIFFLSLGSLELVISLANRGNNGASLRLCSRISFDYELLQL